MPSRLFHTCNHTLVKSIHTTAETHKLQLWCPPHLYSVSQVWIVGEMRMSFTTKRHNIYHRGCQEHGGLRGQHTVQSICTVNNVSTMKFILSASKKNTSSIHVQCYLYASTHDLISGMKSSAGVHQSRPATCSMHTSEWVSLLNHNHMSPFQSKSISLPPLHTLKLYTDRLLAKHWSERPEKLLLSLASRHIFTVFICDNAAWLKSVIFIIVLYVFRIVLETVMLYCDPVVMLCSVYCVYCVYCVCV